MNNLFSNKALGISLFAVLIFFSVNSNAQITLGGFAGPMMIVTQVDGETSFLVGGSAAVMVGKYVYVGGYGNVSTSRITRSLQGEEFQIGYTQVGFLAGAVINPKNKIQFTGNTLIGMGRLAAQDNAIKDRLIQIAPYVGVQYSATDFMRTEISGGYRISTSANESLFDNPNLRSPFGGLMLKFGDFN